MSLRVLSSYFQLVAGGNMRIILVLFAVLLSVSTVHAAPDTGFAWRFPRISSYFLPLIRPSATFSLREKELMADFSLLPKGEGAPQGRMRGGSEVDFALSMRAA
jgi:hypothetical protein